MQPATDYTQALAQSLMQLTPSSSDVEQLGNLLLDHVAVATYGARQPSGCALLRWVERHAGSGRSGLIGRDFTVAEDLAAMVNAVAGHGFELDDTHDPSLSHPGAVVFPAALAAAAEVQARGSEVLAAVAAGYETIARLGAAIDAACVIARGFHPTALLGVFGAATAAARTLRLRQHELQCAWGHALSLTGGSMQFSQEPAGADVKRLHAGHAARNGVLAAQMAAIGIAAPARSLDGRYGLLALYGQHCDAEQLLADAARPAIHGVSMKPYACNRLLHSMIDGLREITAPDLDPRAVARLLVRGPRKLVEQHMIRRPASTMAAQYSLPFTAGAAIVYGPEDFTVYDTGRLADQRILQWADKVTACEDAELEAQFPRHFGTKIELTLTSGEGRSICVLDSVGTPARPMKRSAIQTKARNLLRGHAAGAFERLSAAVEAFSAADSTAQLQRALATAG